MTNNWMDMVKIVKNAYIEVMGQEEWDNLREKQKHDMVIVISKVIIKILNSLE